MRVGAAAAVYFAWVFGAGFLLGVVRVPLLVPRMGERAATLAELPVMLCIAWWIARERQRRTADLTAVQQIGVGVLAMALLLVTECGVGFLVQGRGPYEVLVGHDPIAGSAFLGAVALVAAMPWWWTARDRRARTGPPAALD